MNKFELWKFDYISIIRKYFTTLSDQIANLKAKTKLNLESK